ncbi:ComEA family DNA-binding protein [Vibrio sp. SM6]|uniref:ComEA family DNA-binding protein n=2 Tax=Vibrio agarilyticus TaxID=2726741 RepID=A0A7X8TSA0_9VIBR|nr:helix-hairpin-helix domain-containing protein [Vibrio agarilyticus]NLS13878.1 ComEA family DNA-binding protein [Vibrio agarilyticus]
MPYALADEQIAAKGDPFEGIEITVNINQASAQEIADLLVGIGIKKAEDIVSYRQEHGHFDSLESLDQVKGIGPSTLAKNKTRILFK